QTAEIVVDGCDIRMIRSRRSFEYRERAPIHGLGLIEPAHVFVKHAKIVQHPPHFKVVCSKGRFSECRSLTEKPLGLPLPALDSTCFCTASQQPRCREYRVVR